jgi:hypothetical protein
MWTIVKTATCFGQCMSIIGEFEVFLTETVCCFRCCLSVVSVVLVVGFHSFGIVWDLSCVLFRLVSVLLMLFSGVLVQYNEIEQHQSWASPLPQVHQPDGPQKHRHEGV